MRNKNLDWDEGGNHDYSPNELANLPEKEAREIVESNLESGETFEGWQHKNLARAQRYLSGQRIFHDED